MRDPLKACQSFSYHFVGIGGIGMSALAQVVRGRKHTVTGSDRNYDRNVASSMFDKLICQDIPLYPQDGSGVGRDTDFVVVSSAVEEDNPDVKKARELNVRIIKRAGLLAEIFNAHYGVAVGGTNGKTTVSCMASYILDYAGYSPTIVVGGCMKNYVTNNCIGNSKPGESDIISIEADESDGSVVLYLPHISVITNISKDHKTVGETARMFEVFSKNTRDTLILNADCPNLRSIGFKHNHTVTYGIKHPASFNATNIVCEPFRSTFELQKQSYEINLPGLYNVSNALAAIVVAKTMNIDDDITAMALRQFSGVQRRMDVIGEVNGVTVIDDYAHNPEKIVAAINAVKLGCKRVIAIFQPHGYGPANFMKEDLIRAFTYALSGHDILFMPEIYYSGGTAVKNISSADIIRHVRALGKRAFFFEKRDEIIPEVLRYVHTGDCILVMGARDYTLSDFCRGIVSALKDRDTVYSNG